MTHFRTLASLLILSSSGFAIGEYDFTDNMAPSQTPPGGLTAKQVPQFITLGVDDLSHAGWESVSDTATTGPMGIRYLINYFDTKTNPAGSGNAGTLDGTPARIAFYCTSTYLATWSTSNPNTLKWIINEAWTKGHEIGLHSQTHGDAIKSGSQTYLTDGEIQPCISWLTKPLPPKGQPISDTYDSQGAGIPIDEIYGWRTPFLAYGGELLPSLKANKVSYDCTIEEGSSPEQDGTNFRWPYTLDAGSPGHSEGWAGNPDNPAAFTVPNTPGLWELPNHVAMLPPDSVCSKYGVEYSIRSKMTDYLTKKDPKQEWFTPEIDRFTCFDYNYWAQMGLNGKDVTAILKYTLDLRLEGNRAPFMIGAHDLWFHNTNDATVPSTYTERQKAFADFFEYALSKPEVRVVRPIDIINWCRNPVALNDIHYRVKLTVIPDTVLVPATSNKYPVWSDTTRYDKPSDTVIYNDHIWAASGWNYDNIGIKPGTSTYWNDAGFNGDVVVSTPGKIEYASNLIKKSGSGTFTFTPENGAKVTQLIVNGTQISPASSWTFTNVTENQSIAVRFGEKEVGISSKSVISDSKSVSATLSGNHLALSVPREGSYLVSMYQPNGKALFTKEITLKTGVNQMDMTNVLSSVGMVILKIEGEGSRFVQKVMQK